MPLFDHKLVQIGPATEQKTLSKAQKQFNSLIKNIEAQKKLLREWQETLPRIQQQSENELAPLVERFNAHRMEIVQILDRAYESQKFAKKDREKIKHIICEISFELISAHGKEELKGLYNKYSSSGFDAEKQEADAIAQDFMNDMMQSMFGEGFCGDLDFTSPETMHASLEEKLQAINEREQEKQRQAEERRGKRKKTTKQLEKEAKQLQEKQSISKSIQEVFRKLAAALHPDREPDLQERERKTEIMQRVNAAYAKNDLLQLLELQLEVEQINQAHLDNIAETRLKHYNTVLKEQLEELRDEITQIEQSFRMQLAIPPFEKLTPKLLVQHLGQDIRRVRRDISIIRDDVRTFHDAAALKVWLKSYEIPKQQGLFDSADFFSDGFAPPFPF